ncbi:MAG: TfoX/Sxy family protein [Gammaproteobacteria bacterium]|nr:TfoX/Sxy family protein [Gammaproteobacteria bacterium]
MGELSKLKGLGPKSERSLNEIGIYSKEDLEKTGAVRAFLQMEKECSIKPGLNFLYAMVGALENKSWIEIAKQEKERLIFEIEGCKELDNLFSDENSVINK